MKKTSTQKLRLALVGASGRMGQNVLDLIHSDELFTKKYELVWSGSLRNKSDIKNLVDTPIDILIDFSNPEGTLKWIESFAKSKTLLPPSLVCVTGFSKAQFAKLERSFGKTNWKYLPNTSMGIAALKTCLKVLAQNLDSNYRFSIFESHHKHKIDSPSGTALALQKAIEEVSSHKVEIFSTRGGSDPGTHKVFVLGPHEKLEFTHSAENRKLFAHGALAKALELITPNKKGRK